MATLLVQAIQFRSFFPKLRGKTPANIGPKKNDCQGPSHGYVTADTTELSIDP
jgi:hypothetical protein